MTDTISDEARELTEKVWIIGNRLTSFDTKKTEIAAVIQSALTAARQEAACKERDRIATIVSGWRNKVPMSGEECANAIRALSLEEQP